MTILYLKLYKDLYEVIWQIPIYPIYNKKKHLYHIMDIMCPFPPSPFNLCHLKPQLKMGDDLMDHSPTPMGKECVRVPHIP